MSVLLRPVQTLMVVFCFWLICVSGQAVQAQPVVEVVNAWIRLMPPGQSMTAAYFELTNTDEQALVLVSVHVDWAKAAHLHATEKQAGVLRMVSVDQLALEPGKTEVFSPGGRHVMIMGLAEPLKAGDKLPLSLRFRRQGSQAESFEQTFLATVQ